MYRLKKWIILIGSLLLLIAFIVASIYMGFSKDFKEKHMNKNKDQHNRKEEEYHQEQNYDNQDDDHDSNSTYAKISTESWEDRAIIGKISPDKIEEIVFTKTRQSNVAEQAWVFDGIRCYLNEGVLNVVTGENGIKIKASMKGAFSNLKNLKKIYGFELIDTSDVKNMDELFKNCSSLTSISFNSIEIDSLRSTSYMFYGCSSLEKLDLSKVDMSYINNVDYMFAWCEKLNTLTLPKTCKIISAEGLFEGIGISAQSGTVINGILNTSDCENMSYMFQQSRLHDYQFASSLDTSNLKNAEKMFYSCAVYIIDLSKWNTSKIETVKNMFGSNMSLKSCNMSGWDVSSLKSCEGMFYMCAGLKEVTIDWKNIGNIQNGASMFYNCFGLTEIDMSCFNNVKFGDSREMFMGCQYLATIYGNGFKADISDRMFKNCSSLIGKVQYSDKKVDISMANTNGYFTSK